MTDVLRELIPLIAPIVILSGLIWRGFNVAWKRLETKLDEGRVIALATAEDLKSSTAEQAQQVAEKLAAHNKSQAEQLNTVIQPVMSELTQIKDQTTATNGKVAEHDKQITVLTARTDLLTEIYLKNKPE